MAKAFPDIGQRIYNKLGAWAQDVLPHAEVVIGAPAAEAADEIVKLVVNATRSLRVHLSEAATVTGMADVITNTGNTATSCDNIDIELDSAIEDHDAVQADPAMMKVGGLAHAGTPAAVAAGDNAQFAFDTTQSVRMYPSQASHYSNDSMTTRETPASGGEDGVTAISNVASTALNGGTSLECIWVEVQNQGTGWMRITIGTASATTGIILQPGDIWHVEVDNVAKVSLWAQNLNDPAGWAYGSRA